MYFEECDMNIKDFDVSINLLYRLIEDEFEKNPEIKKLLSYKDIMKTMNRTLSVATLYKISIENYIQLIFQSFMSNKSLNEDYLNVRRINENYVHNFLKTLIIRVCCDEEGNTVADNFTKMFDKHVSFYNQIISSEDKFLFCQMLIGKRNAELLYVMLESFYRL